MIKPRKRILSLLLALTLVCTLLPWGTVPAQAAVIDSGSIPGTGQKWQYISNTELKITGTGAMPSWTGITETPWKTYKGGIKTVTIGEGITTVGDCAFFTCTMVSEVSLPSTLTAIGKYAFCCGNGQNGTIKSMVIPKKVTSIGDCAVGFYSVQGYAPQVIPGFTIYGYPGTAAEAYANSHEEIAFYGLPLITLQPKSATVAVGSTTTFKITATGTNLQYQWQYRKAGESAWSNWSGKTAASLTVTGSNTNNSCQYRCRVSNAGGAANSAAVTLTVNTAPVKPTITTNPAAAKVKLGATANFKVAASGTGLSYQWQFSKDNGATWSSWSGKTEPTLSVKASTTNNGCLYRCKVSNSVGTAISSSARLTVSDIKPTIVVQPINATVAVGKTTTMKVVAAGSGLAYQWQYRKVGESVWTSWSGKTAYKLDITGSATNNGCQYRCVVKNSYGTVNSAAATLTVTGVVSKPSITTHPTSKTVALGNSVTFQVAASGSGLQYQWQYKKAGETAWTDWAGKTGSSLSVTGSATNNGCQYRCKVSNSAGAVYSNTATLTVTQGHFHAYSYAVTRKPTYSETGILTGTCSCGHKTTVTIPKLDTSNYSLQTVKAATCTEDGVLCYTWVTTVYGNYSFNTSIPTTGHSFSNGICTRCGVRLSMIPTITSPLPQSTIIIANGKKTTLEITASGSGTLTYQWQYKKADEEIWRPYRTASTRGSVAVTGSATNNGCSYRCIVTSSVHSGAVAYSNEVKVIVTGT